MEAAKMPMVGVSCIIVNEGKVLVGLRKSAHGANTWCPPGGKLDLNEDPADAAIREAFEETGLILHSPVFAAMTNDIFSESGKHYITLHYVCRYEGGKPSVREPEKFIDLRWVPWNEIPEPLFLTIENLNKQKFNPLNYLPKQ